MFKRLAAEALGISDIGTIIGPQDYDKVDADDYLFHEDGEKIFFLIKSKKDEYCFTNYALIHVDGQSAVSSKRTVKRYEYSSQQIGYCVIETAGNMDMDVELKFSIGGTDFSIDIKKSLIEQVKDIYKALLAIAKQQHRDSVSRDNALRTLQSFGEMVKLGNIANEQSLVAHYNAVLVNLNAIVLDHYTTRDFSKVFERYIHNGAPPPRVAG